MKHKDVKLHLRIPIPELAIGTVARWLPTRGNVIFTLLMIGLLLWTQSAGALPLPASLRSANTSTGTIAYQGRLADAGGNPQAGVALYRPNQRPWAVGPRIQGTRIVSLPTIDPRYPDPRLSPSRRDGGAI